MPASSGKENQGPRNSVLDTHDVLHTTLLGERVEWYSSNPWEPLSWGCPPAGMNPAARWMPPETVAESNTRARLERQKDLSPASLGMSIIMFWVRHEGVVVSVCSDRIHAREVWKDETGERAGPLWELALNCCALVAAAAVDSSAAKEDDNTLAAIDLCTRCQQTRRAHRYATSSPLACSNFVEKR